MRYRRFQPLCRVLWITSELQPYVEMSSAGYMVRNLLPVLYRAGMEVRIIIPRYGMINPRKHRLHDVVRLSGLHIPAGSREFRLHVRVVTLPDVRFQVYFVDNPDLFRDQETLYRPDGTFVPDNGTRMVFFVRSALEMMVRLGWVPDIVHCHGWFSALAPFLIQKVYRKEPVFARARLLVSVYDDHFPGRLEDLTAEILQVESFLTSADVSPLVQPTCVDLWKAIFPYVEGVLLGSPYVLPEILEYIREKKPDLLWLRLDDPSAEQEFLHRHVAIYHRLLG